MLRCYGYDAKKLTDGKLTDSLIVVVDDNMNRSAAANTGALCMSSGRMVDELKTAIADGKGDTKPGLAIDLGKIVPLVDVSGSMHGTPMEVAISLGILVSEIASPAYANRCLTFSARPEWVEFESSMTLVQKVDKMRYAQWDMNTDFEAAMERILDVAKKAS